MLRYLLRLFFRLLYHELAWTYDWVSAGVSLGEWRAWQRAVLPFLRGRRVLELAHGTGDLLLDLSALGFQPVGVDRSPEMGAQARRKLGRHGLRLPLTRAVVQALPFAAGAFDSLTATFPTEYMLDPAAIAEFRRVLRPGGALVLAPTAHLTGRGWLERLAAGLFSLTGQAREDWFAGLAALYRQHGFSARMERVRLARSEVLVIIAE